MTWCFTPSQQTTVWKGRLYRNRKQRCSPKSDGHYTEHKNIQFLHNNNVVIVQYCPNCPNVPTWKSLALSARLATRSEVSSVSSANKIIILLQNSIPWQGGSLPFSLPDNWRRFCPDLYPQNRIIISPWHHFTFARSIKNSGLKLFVCFSLTSNQLTWCLW